MSEQSYWSERRWARRRFLAGAGALGGAAFLAACGGGDDEPAPASQATTGPSTGGTTAAGAQATSAPAGRQLSSVKVGGMTDRTSPLSVIGKPLGQGHVDYAEYANASNLAGRKVEWLDFDNNYQADKGKEGYKRFVEQDKVVSILSFGTPITEAISPQAQEDKIPIWTPGFGVGEQIDGTKFPYSFIGAANYPSQAMALLQHFKDTFKDTSRKAKVYYLYFGNAAGRDPLDTFKAQTPKFNMDLVGTLEVPGTTTDLTQQMLEVKSKDPDYVVTHFFGAIPPLSLKAAQGVGIAPEKIHAFVWGTGDGDYKTAGSAAESTYGLQFTTLPGDNPEVFAKMKEYFQKQGKTLDDARMGDPVYYARGVYNAAIIFEAIKLAGDKDKLTGEDVKKGADQMKDSKLGGLAAGVTMTPQDHMGSRKVRLYQVKGGKQTLIKDWFEGPKPS